MKTCTITWITYKNYGTFLQAYALQNIIKSLGYENVILSDKPIVEKNLPRVKDRLTFRSYKNGKKGNFLYQIRLFHGFLNDFSHEKIYYDTLKQFDIFQKKKLDVYEIAAVDKYYEIKNQFSCFICGSDQIWSLLEYNFNEYFFLGFTSKPKIAYAPSIGQSELPEPYRTRMCELVRNFQALSCRERSSASQLSELLERDVKWVCDPTLLLGAEHWKKIGTKKYHKNKYILCYFLENKEWYFQYANQVSGYLGIEYVLIPNRREYAYFDHVEKKAVGPEGFVSLFQSADFVLTDSYHGSIFSLIFNKQFIYLKRFADGPISQNIRIDSLFGYLGIMGNIISEKVFDEKDIQSLDYREINAKIEEHRKNSMDYLKRSLDNANQ